MISCRDTCMLGPGAEARTIPLVMLALHAPAPAPGRDEEPGRAGPRPPSSQSGPRASGHRGGPRAPGRWRLVGRRLAWRGAARCPATPTPAGPLPMPRLARAKATGHLRGAGPGWQIPRAGGTLYRPHLLHARVRKTGSNGAARDAGLYGKSPWESATVRVCSLRSDPGADQRLALARREPRRNVDGGFRFLVQDARMLHRPWARRIKRQRPYKFTAGAHAAWPARVGFMRPSGQYRGASCLSPKAYISTDLRPPLPSGPPLPMEREYPTAARSPAAPPCRGVSTPCSPSLQGCEYPL